MAAQTASNPAVFRPIASFAPSIWGDRFITLSLDHSTREEYVKQIKVLKEEVRSMLLDATINSVEKMNLINLLVRLGLSYHFEDEIDEQLDGIFSAHANYDGYDYDLYTVALHFRVLRQHGYKIPCDVFNKFQDNNGKFKKILESDVKGMLSLYEATHLRIHGEDILDEALEFTTAILKSWEATEQTNSPIVRNIRQALRRPFHKGMPRLETRQFISYYQEEESRNDLLLKFAKLDYNMLQMLYQEELSHLSKWWKESEFVSKLSYARDRIVELLFWMSGVYFEPCYSSGRIMLTKFIAILSVIDDTYDAYGTLEELKLFTDAMQRWDISAIVQLPDYMKELYKGILNFSNEIEKEMTNEGRLYSIYYLKEAMKEMARAYYTEAKWFNERYVPPLNEYLSSALITSDYYVITIVSFIGMGEIADKNVFEWIQNRPRNVVSSETICRLMDDVTSHKHEQMRGHVASAVECYMKQYGATEEEACVEFCEMVANAWKDMNEECLKPTAVSRHLLVRSVNLARMIEVIYEYDDGYTNAEKCLKDYIRSLFVEPIPMQE